MAIISGGGGFATKRVSQKIDLPKDWPKLVAKYKSVYPKYRQTCGESCGF